MQDIHVIIGAFRRPVFGEGLRARLAEYPGFTVSRLGDDDPATPLAELEGPVVLVLDANAPGLDLSALPERPATVLILIGDEGRSTVIRLSDLDVRQIKDLVLVATGRPVVRRVAAAVRPGCGIRARVRSLGQGVAACVAASPRGRPA